MNSASDVMDLNRLILLTKLPSSLMSADKKGLMNTLGDLVVKNFGLSNDTVEKVYRCKTLDSLHEENGCSCLVSFRSRVHKDHVIAQRSKIETPMTVDEISDIPPDFDHFIEGVDTNDEVNNTNNIDSAYADAAITTATDVTEENVSNNVQNELVEIDNRKDIGADLCDESQHIDANSDTNEATAQISSDRDAITENFHDSAHYVEHAGTKLPADSANNFDVESDGKVERSDSKLEDAIKGDEKSPGRSDRNSDPSVDLYGAPCFLWKRVKGPIERKLVVICNALSPDLYNPWMYAMVMQSHLTEAHFPVPVAQDGTKDSYGRIKLHFAHEDVMMACVLSYMVNIRTTKARRLQVSLPQTRTALMCKEEINERLGRAQAPPLEMRQLVIKAASQSVTEEVVRNVSFNNFPVESVDIQQDPTNLTVTFASAELAVAAHSCHNYVRFNDSRGEKDWIKVQYSGTSNDVTVVSKLRSSLENEYNKSSQLMKGKQSKTENVANDNNNKEACDGNQDPTSDEGKKDDEKNLSGEGKNEENKEASERAGVKRHGPAANNLRRKKRRTKGQGVSASSDSAKRQGLRGTSIWRDSFDGRSGRQYRNRGRDRPMELRSFDVSRRVLPFTGRMFTSDESSFYGGDNTFNTNSHYGTDRQYPSQIGSRGSRYMDSSRGSALNDDWTSPSLEGYRDSVNLDMGREGRMESRMVSRNQDMRGSFRDPFVHGQQYAVPERVMSDYGVMDESRRMNRSDGSVTYRGSFAANNGIPMNTKTPLLRNDGQDVGANAPFMGMSSMSTDVQGIRNLDIPERQFFCSQPRATQVPYGVPPQQNQTHMPVSSYKSSSYQGQRYPY